MRDRILLYVEDNDGGRHIGGLEHLREAVVRELHRRPRVDALHHSGRRVAVACLHSAELYAFADNSPWHGTAAADVQKLLAREPTCEQPRSAKDKDCEHRATEPGNLVRHRSMPWRRP